VMLAPGSSLALARHLLRPAQARMKQAL
jgi:hypothetical protein